VPCLVFALLCLCHVPSIVFSFAKTNQDNIKEDKIRQDKTTFHGRGIQQSGSQPSSTFSSSPPLQARRRPTSKRAKGVSISSLSLFHYLPLHLHPRVAREETLLVGKIEERRKQKHSPAHTRNSKVLFSS
jgi:hypothetical protein